MTPPIIECISKLKRARKHLANLQSRSQKWLLDNASHRRSTKKDPDRPGYYQYSIHSSCPNIPLDPFALIIGDVLHNLRSSLDHLVYALALNYTGSLSEEVARNLQFPIFGDKDWNGKMGVGNARFERNRKAWIGAIHPEAQAFIKNLQPYHKGNAFAEHALWKFHQLSNLDKHRLLLTSASRIGKVSLDPAKCVNVDTESVIVDFSGGPIKTNTEIVRCSFLPINPDRKVDVNFVPSLDIVFKCGSVVDEKRVLDVFAAIYNFIAIDVYKPLSKYL